MPGDSRAVRVATRGYVVDRSRRTGPVGVASVALATRATRLRVVAVVVTLVGFLSLVANVAISAASDRVGWADTGWPWQAATAACVVAGALIALSRPTHPIGWLFLALGVLTPLSGAILAAQLHVAGTAPSWWLTGPEAVATAEAATIPLVLLLFPTGRLLSRRWRIGVAFVLGAAVVGTLSAVMNGGWGGDYPGEAGSAPSPIRGRLHPLGDVLPAVFYPLLLAGFVAAGLSLVVRYRRSRGEERLQLRWLAAAAALLLVLAPFSILGGGNDDVVTALFVVNICLIPLAAGVAVLRYRLYDIDVVINRTLVYAGLSAILAGAYLGSVLVLQFALRPLTDRSDLAVAGSTLAVAALFRPARARIQAAVDRRFYRRRYDAAQTLEMFSGRLREQLDLEALGADLRGVVKETVQPSYVSLWLRPAR
ncbi:MAG: hypothetical protein M3513_11525 [Actinomycetota bacterium]|nr:hypothetical protein [Actinomycetota bacterium]